MYQNANEQKKNTSETNLFTYHKLALGRLVTSENQSSDILQHSQNRPTGDRWLKFLNTTIHTIQ